MGIARCDELGAALAGSREAAASPRTARSGLRVVYRRVRHARSEGGESAARHAGGMRLSKKRATSELGSNGHAVHPREGLPSETRASGLRCAEASNALIRVHKASTQNQKLRTKTSKISMSQRDNRKSCHSDQYLGDPQIPFPTVSPTDISLYVVVLHDAAKGAMRTTARVRRQRLRNRVGR